MTTATAILEPQIKNVEREAQSLPDMHKQTAVLVQLTKIVDEDWYALPYDSRLVLRAIANRDLKAATEWRPWWKLITKLPEAASNIWLYVQSKQNIMAYAYARANLGAAVRRRANEEDDCAATAWEEARRLDPNLALAYERGASASLEHGCAIKVDWQTPTPNSRLWTARRFGRW